MVANYNPSTASGVTWVRCNAVHIVNEYGKTPIIRFNEEKILTIGDEVVTKLSPSSAVVFDAENGVVPLVNPETNLPTGETVTHMQIYQILHSAYLQAAMARDAAEGP